jgi:hypothetical protein
MEAPPWETPQRLQPRPKRSMFADVKSSSMSHSIWHPRDSSVLGTPLEPPCLGHGR